MSGACSSRRPQVGGPAAAIIHQCFSKHVFRRYCRLLRRLFRGRENHEFGAKQATNPEIEGVAEHGVDPACILRSTVAWTSNTSSGESKRNSSRCPDSASQCS